MMKKMIAMLMLAAMMLSLCACGGNVEPTAAPTAPNATEAPTEPQPTPPSESAPTEPTGKSYTVKLADGINTAANAAAPAPAAGGAAKAVTTPLPGTVMKIEVKVGQAVKAGETIAILEAMKMETPVASDVDGVVSSIAVSVGDVVGEGDTLVMIG